MKDFSFAEVGQERFGGLFAFRLVKPFQRFHDNKPELLNFPLRQFRGQQIVVRIPLFRSWGSCKPGIIITLTDDNTGGRQHDFLDVIEDSYTVRICPVVTRNDC